MTDQLSHKLLETFTTHHGDQPTINLDESFGEVAGFVGALIPGLMASHEAMTDEPMPNKRIDQLADGLKELVTTAIDVGLNLKGHQR